MMKPKLKELWSPDLPEGETCLPVRPENCWVVVQADIGLPETEAADTFTFYVCTPQFLQESLKKTSFLLGVHTIILNKFDWLEVRLAIETVCNRSSDENWSKIVSKLNCFGECEFSG